MIVQITWLSASANLVVSAKYHSAVCNKSLTGNSARAACSLG